MQPTKKTSPNRILNGIRYFNKYLLNHITLLFAGTKAGPFSKMIHIGRKSGKIFETPVVATYIDDRVLIPLTYGDQVDWLKNILAQGGCEIIYSNTRRKAVGPTVISAKAAFIILPEKRRRIFERFKLEKFLQMQVLK
ncbi:MAG: hypothetical protein RBT01_11795 [Anaerolineaceae bacterium]|nr:hypothetical protein [Anaerolineaceae bacterium]